MRKKYLFLFIAYFIIGIYSFFTAKIQPDSLLENIVNFCYYLFFWPVVIILYIISLVR